MGDFSYDPLAGLSDEEILASDIDGKISDIASSLDKTLTSIVDDYKSNVIPLDVLSSQLRNQITEPVDTELRDITEFLEVSRLGFADPVDAEIDAINGVADQLSTTVQLNSFAPSPDHYYVNIRECTWFVDIPERVDLSDEDIIDIGSVNDISQQHVQSVVDACAAANSGGGGGGGTGGGGGGGSAEVCPTGNTSAYFSNGIEFPPQQWTPIVEDWSNNYPTGIEAMLPELEVAPTVVPATGTITPVVIMSQGIGELWRGEATLIDVNRRFISDDLFLACFTVPPEIMSGPVDQQDNQDEMGWYYRCAFGDIVSLPFPADVDDSYKFIKTGDRPTDSDIASAASRCPRPDDDGGGGNGDNDVQDDDVQQDDGDHDPIGDIGPAIRNILGMRAGECKDVLPAGVVLEGVNSASSFVSALLGIQEDGLLDKILNFLTPGGQGGIAKILVGLLTNSGDSIKKAFEASFSANNCEIASTAQLVMTRAVMTVINHYSGGSLREQITALNQVIASQCPTGVPTPTEALSSFLANEISAEQLECLVKANNQTWDWWKYVAEGARSKWDMPTLINMRRRGLLTAADFAKNARRLGWLSDAESDAIWTISEQVPFQSDIIRMMQRDAADEVNIDWTESDRTFGDKFTGPLKRWARWQGVPEEVFKLNWRAHWRIPSNTELWTILHRIGRDARGNWIPAVLDRVKKALQQNDIMPDWIDDLVNISYSLPRLSQIKQLAFSGIFSRQDIFDQFAKRGLESKTADAMTIQTMKEVEKHYLSHPLVRAYSKGHVSGAKLETVLRREGADRQTIEYAKAEGLLLLQQDTAKKCIDAVRRKYMSYSITAVELEQELGNITGDLKLAEELSKGIACERKSLDRKDSASEMCGWFDNGLIGEEDFIRRLEAIGYNHDDAIRVVTRCVIKRDNRIIRENRAERRRRLADARRIEADMRRNARAGERDEREREREREAEEREIEEQAKLEERNREKTEKARETAARNAEKRKERVLAAAKVFCNRNKCDLDTAFDYMWGSVISASRDGLATQEHASRVASTVAGFKGVGDLAAWYEQFIAALAESSELN